MTLNDPMFSPYGRACQRPSPVARMMAAFAADFRAGVDVNLGVGYVNESTIPRDLIAEATRHVLSSPEQYDKPLNYGAPAGSAILIGAIRRYLAGRRLSGLSGDLLDRKRIIIGSSGATSLLEATAAVLQPGIVVTSDPMYYIYCDYLERMGYEILAVPEDHDGLRTDLLADRLAALGPRTHEVRFIYVVTVSNPTGTILSNPRRRQLLRAAEALSRGLGRRVPLLMDRAYEELIHDEAAEPPVSVLGDDEAGIVYEVCTLSKTLAPGLRIGYMVGEDGPLMRAIVQRTSDIGFSAPPTSQAVAAYLLDHHVDGQIAAVNAGYRRKARQTRLWIEQRLGDEVVDCRGGRAGFYFYLTFRDVETHEDSPFLRYLARATGEPAIDGPPGNPNPRVLCIPGRYCVHPRGDLVEQGRRQLRLSYGFEELPSIDRALAIMAEAVAYARSRQRRATWRGCRRPREPDRQQSEDEA